MKYLTLPIRLVRFWYLESIETFIRTWRNLILLLEEDLAVGLMWKLLFTPLFQDSTVVGRVLSFVFRLGRILVGLFAFSLASALMFALALFWLLLPLFVGLGTFGVISRVILALGVGFFTVHLILHPHRKLWRVKKTNPWEASLVKRGELNLKNLLSSFPVRDLLAHLELPSEKLPSLATISTQEEDRLIEKAYQLASESGCPYIEPSHFFVALVQISPNIEQELLKLDLTLDDFQMCLKYLDKKKQDWRMVFPWDDDFSIHHLKGVNRGWLGVMTPTLDAFSEDLTKTAARAGFDDFIGGEKTLEEVVSVLSEQKSRNVILIGPPGSGKTTLIRYLAKMIVGGDAPEALATKRVVLLDLTRLISGIQTQGELANRIKIIFEEVGFAKNVIIAIEEIHMLGEGEVGSSLNLYSLMFPFLESGTFQFIGTTEMESYNQVLQKNGPFARLFTKIELPPADQSQTLKILTSKAIDIERSSKIRISYLSLKQAADLGQKLIRDRVLPDSAISLLEEACGRPAGGWVLKQTIQEVVTDRVKMPLPASGEAEKAQLLNLEDQLHQRLIDQVEAVRVVADTLRRSATGLREENRPVGSFLFVGPTGVGKTELAKALSEIYFKTDGAFIRFDMSEYQNQDSAERLIGGNGQGGKLTDAISNRPFTLLLLDEFEKAHPKILTLFLQVLDDGRLTDGRGKTVDFTNTIIIATSNAASLTIARGLKEGQTLESLEAKAKEELLAIFSPELVNRFDEIVLFKPLSETDLQKIVQLKLNQLKKQMQDKGYLVDFDNSLIPQLATRGFDPVLGARPLRRLIQDTLESKLSRMILENKLTKGQLFNAGNELLQ